MRRLTALRNVYAFVALPATALLLAACEPSAQQQAAPPPPPVTVANPIEKSITEWDEYTGRFDAVDLVEVRARISGVLNEIKFQDGQLIKKGDLLFVIDPRPFERVLDNAKANLVSAEVRAEFTRRDVERGQPLLKNSTISGQVFDQRVQAQQEADASVKAAEANVRTAELDVEFTSIRAPIDGRISRKLVSEGNFVTGGSGTGTLLTTIVTIDPIHFYFDVSEADYLKYARLDQTGARPSSRTTANPIFVSLQDETDFKHKGKMDFVDNRLDAGTGTLRARAVFDNPNGVFSPGLFARARLIGSGEYKALMLPESAIATDQSNRLAYVVAEDGTVSAKQLTLGPLIDGLRVVRAGLDSKDLVIINGVQRARTGIKVNAQKSEIKQDAKAAPAVR